MRRTGVVLAILLAAVSLSAASRGDFDGTVDFSVTLKTLAAVADGTAPFPGGRLLLLTGTVAGVTILNREEPAFRARIELIAGEWFETEDVKSYTCQIDFSGQGWVDVFPARAPVAPEPGVIVAGTRVLIVAQAVRIITAPLGDRRVLLDGIHIRSIQ